MRNLIKTVAIIAVILMAACLSGLIITGLKIGWGPFSFLHTWDADVKKIEENYPAEENQNGIIF